MMTKVSTLFLVFLALSTSSGFVQEGSTLGEAIRLTDYGVEAARKGLWAEASIRWEQALKVFPNFPAAHNNLAVVYEHFGKYEMAKKHYDLALEISKSNRHVFSNNRMFQQFFHKYVKTMDTETRREKRKREKAKANGLQSDGEALQTAELKNQTTDNTSVTEVSSLQNGRENIGFDPTGAYHKVGSSRQVFIKHPKRETPLSGKYRKVYVAGFAPVAGDSSNLNFETTEFLRSELRKFSLYEVVPLDELALPEDEDEFDRLIDDVEFWERLGNKVGADLIIYGLVNFYSEPSDGFYPYEYRDNSGNYRTTTMMIQRTAFTIELDMFFQDAATGDLVHQESFGQTIVYRGRLDANLQSFYDVMNRVLPRFMDLLVPREHDAIRFLVRG